MITVSRLPDFPEPDTMPVIKTVYYPWTNGSFKPFCYVRCAVVEGSGLWLDFTCFERNPEYQKEAKGEAVMEDSCCAATFDLFPQREEALLSVVCNPAGTAVLFLGDGSGSQPQPLEQSLKVSRYGGSDEQGWYWGVRFVLEDELLQELFGSARLPDEILGNFFKFRRAGAASHFGAAADCLDYSIFSRKNLEKISIVNF